jgi:nicotinamide riboside transporter PnuC
MYKTNHDKSEICKMCLNIVESKNSVIYSKTENIEKQRGIIKRENIKNSILVFIEFLIFVISIVSSIFLIYFHRLGFVLGDLCNIISIGYFVYRGNYFLVAQQLSYFVLNIIGIYINYF